MDLQNCQEHEFHHGCTVKLNRLILFFGTDTKRPMSTGARRGMITSRSISYILVCQSCSPLQSAKITPDSQP